VYPEKIHFFFALKKNMDINNFIRLFKKNEVDKTETLSFVYINRKKIVTFVPLNFVDKLTFEMAFAGAGKIGNYDLCSFRTKGLGTFMPGSSAKPFSGKKRKLAFEEEVRLEVECGEENLDNVVDSLLLNHPYEEVAYEIYDFKKRSDIPSSVVINFKRPVTFREIVSRINKNINLESKDGKIKIKTLCLTNSDVNISVITKAKEKNCKLIIFSEKNKLKFKYI
jgi:hypothetical protein